MLTVDRDFITGEVITYKNYLSSRAKVTSNVLTPEAKCCMEPTQVTEWLNKKDSSLTRRCQANCVAIILVSCANSQNLLRSYLPLSFSECSSFRLPQRPKPRQPPGPTWRRRSIRRWVPFSIAHARTATLAAQPGHGTATSHLCRGWSSNT